jgi:hypothetical protein
VTIDWREGEGGKLSIRFSSTDELDGFFEKIDFAPE